MDDTPRARHRIFASGPVNWASVACRSASPRPNTRSPTTPSAPTPGWTLRVTDVSLSAGAGFLVVIAGAMMPMSGLPKLSRALAIDVDAHGEITGMQ